MVKRNPRELYDRSDFFGFSGAVDALLSLLAREHPDLASPKENIDRQEKRVLDRFGSCARQFIEELREVRRLVNVGLTETSNRNVDWADVLYKATSVIGLILRYASSPDSLSEFFHEVILTIACSPKYMSTTIPAWYIHVHRAIARYGATDRLVRRPARVHFLINSLNRKAEVHWVREGWLPNELESVRLGWLPEHVARALPHLLTPLQWQQRPPTGARSAIEELLLEGYFDGTQAEPCETDVDSPESEAYEYVEWCSQAVPGPEEDLVRIEEEMEAEMRILGSLNRFEADVLMRRNQGVAYQQVAESLGVSVKSVDNALQRVKRKVQALSSVRYAV